MKDSSLFSIGSLKILSSAKEFAAPTLEVSSKV
jgi:hypothetical protein